MTITVNRKVQECEKTGCLFYVYKYSTPDGLEFPTPDLAFHHIERQNTVSDWSSRGVYEGSVILHRNTERTYGKVIRILSDSKYLELLLDNPQDGFNKHFLGYEEFDFYYTVKRDKFMEQLGVRPNDEIN
jgi:hypothetical protein